MTEEQLLAGRAVPAEPELTAFVAALRAGASDAPAPVPSAALAALLRDGLPAVTVAGPAAHVSTDAVAAGTTADPVAAPGAADPVAAGATADPVAVPPRADEAHVVDLASAARRPRRTGRGTRRVVRRTGAAAVVAVGIKVAVGAAAAAAVVTGTAQLDSAPAVVRDPARAVVGVVVDAWHGVTGTTPPAPAPTVEPEQGGPAVVPAPASSCATGCDPAGGPGVLPPAATSAPGLSRGASGGAGASDGAGASEDAGRPAAVPDQAPAGDESHGQQGAPGQDRRATPAPSAPADPPGRGGRD